MTVLVRAATEEDVARIAPMLVPEQGDRLAMSPGGAAGVLRLSLRQSEDTVWAEDDGVPLCLGGVIPYGGTFLSQHGAMWMAISVEFEKHPKRFLRESRRIVGAWKERYCVLRDFCDVSDARNMRWLRWLGFDFGDAVRSPLDGTIVYPVEWRRWA